MILLSIAHVIKYVLILLHFLNISQLSEHFYFLKKCISYVIHENAGIKKNQKHIISYMFF